MSAPTRHRRVAGQGAAHLALAGWAALAAFPVAWSVVGSLKSDAEIFASPWSLPAAPRWDNYVRAWREAGIGRFFANTVVVVGGALALTLALGAMAAYVLARFSFRLNRTVRTVFLAGMVFPVFLAIVPLFVVVDALGLLGTQAGLILVLAAYGLPFTVFFLTGFFSTLPGSVAEAALLDGCGHAGAFFRVMLPMALPGLASVAVFDFLGLWNGYLLPLVLNPDPERYVLAQGLASLAVTQGYAADYSALFAGLVLTMAPVLVVYVLLHRRLRGLSLGALR
ncbi:carbohydrate ABC transporter permease [Xylanimonas allomyrinae]|uniref:carbohydrate ABC transporter permease n=1 Tax=Xylanimonas allomyrinae TaxID=2509459 RepID=UPI001B8822B0|nr:carbohydrate ABC transporter permease [Xylanimonas allomyrinae]